MHYFIFDVDTNNDYHSQEITGKNVILYIIILYINKKRKKDKITNNLWLNSLMNQVNQSSTYTVIIIIWINQAISFFDMRLPRASIYHISRFLVMIMILIP